MKPPFIKSPSEVFLVCVNLLPLAGALLWGWKIFDILLLYWVENVIIGIINIVKMVAVMARRRWWIALPIVPFFLFHYGMFCLVHGIFVVAIFGLNPRVGEGADWAETQAVILGATSDPLFLLAVAGLVASHGYSFFANFLKGGEIEHASLLKLMHAPYGRVVALHMTIILGGGVALALGQPLWALALLTILKTIGDLRAHRRSHAARNNPPSETTLAAQ